MLYSYEVYTCNRRLIEIIGLSQVKLDLPPNTYVLHLKVIESISVCLSASFSLCLSASLSLSLRHSLFPSLSVSLSLSLPLSFSFGLSDSLSPSVPLSTLHCLTDPTLSPIGYRYYIRLQKAQLDERWTGQKSIWSLDQIF